MNKMPVITIVGRPNVGKSTLFNKFTKTRAAIVADLPGVTRDRQYGIGHYDNKRFIVVDTGGLAPVNTEDAIEKNIMNMTVTQVKQAINQSDQVLCMVDGQSGLTPADEILIADLRKQEVKLSIVVNKADRYQEAEMASEFYSLGIENLYVIAAKTGRGINTLLESILSQSCATSDEKNLSPTHNESKPDDGQSSHEGRPDEEPHTIENKSDEGQSASKNEPSENEPSENEPSENEPSENEPTKDQAEKAQISTPPISIAMLGRPNVGKSTLINAMLGEERVMVCDAPGTTRDAISIPFKRGKQNYILIDTAGIRRRGHSHPTVEKFSVIKSMQAIEKADVIIAVLDASGGIQEQDMRLLQQATLNGSALVIAYNKWDKLDEQERELFKQQVDRRLSFVDFARRYHISALHGSGLGELYRATAEAHRGLQQDFTTAGLTQTLEQAIKAHQPPLVKGRRIRLRYAHLVETKPLTIMIHGKQIPSIAQSYQRYLIGFFRKKLRLTGVILHITLKNDTNPYVDEKD